MMMMMNTVSNTQPAVKPPVKPGTKPVVKPTNGNTTAPKTEKLPTTPSTPPKTNPQDVLKATEGLKGKEKRQVLDKLEKAVTLKQSKDTLSKEELDAGGRLNSSKQQQLNQTVEEYKQVKQAIRKPIEKVTTEQAQAEVKAKQPKPDPKTNQPPKPKTPQELQAEAQKVAKQKLEEKDKAIENFVTAGSSTPEEQTKAKEILRQEKVISDKQERLGSLNIKPAEGREKELANEKQRLQQEIIQLRQRQALGDIDAQNITPEAKVQAKARFKAQQATQLAKDTGLDANTIKTEAEKELKKSGIQYDQISTQTGDVNKDIPKVVTHEDRIAKEKATKALYETAQKPGDKPTENYYSLRLNKDNKTATADDKEAVDIKLSGISSKVKENGEKEYSRTIIGKDGKQIVVTSNNIEEVSLYAKNKDGKTVRGGLVVGREGAGKNEIIARQNAVTRAEDGSLQVGEAKVVSRTRGNWGIGQGYRIEKDVVGADVDNGDQTVNIRPDGKVEVVSGTGNWFARGNNLKDVEKDLVFNDARLTTSNPSESSQPKKVADLSKEQKQKLNIAEDADANTVLNKDQREQVATEASRQDLLAKTRTTYANATLKNYTFKDASGNEAPLVNIGDNYKVQLSNVLETKNAQGEVTSYSRVVRAEDGRKIVVTGKNKEDVEIATDKDKPGLKISKTWTGDFGTDFQVSQTTVDGDKETQRVRGNWKLFGGTSDYRVEIDNHNSDVYGGDRTVYLNNDGTVQDTIAGSGNWFGHGYNLNETGHTLAEAQANTINSTPSTTQQSSDTIETPN